MTRQRYEPQGVSEQNSASRRNPKYRSGEYHKSRFEKESGGKIWPRFTHTRLGEVIEEFDDGNYFLGMLRKVAHGDTDSKTAFKNLMIDIYKEMRVAGNMKDIVDAQETAFSVLALDSFMLTFDLAYQEAFRELLANPSESNTTGSGSTHVCCWELNSFNILLGDIKNKNLVIPKFVKNILDDLLFIIKLDPEYAQGAVQLPPRFCLPFVGDMTLAEAQAFVVEWSSNNALAKIHMDKFGIDYETWRPELVFDMPELQLHDVKVLDYFAVMPIYVRDGSTTRQVGDYDIDAGTGWEALEWYCVNDPNESPLKSYLPLFCSYESTNNPYGGILCSIDCKLTQNYTNMIQCKYANTDGSYTELVIGAEITFVSMYRAMWKQTNTLNWTITGSYLSGEYDATSWPLAEIFDMKYGTGLSKSLLEGILKLQISRKDSGGSKRKPNRSKKAKAAKNTIGDFIDVAKEGD